MLLRVRSLPVALSRILAPLLTASAALLPCAACHSTESLGMASPACEDGGCLAPSVIAADATIDVDGGPELMRIASLLYGTFEGSLIVPPLLAVTQALDDAVVSLEFTPDKDPLSGQYSASCVGASCVGPFAAGFHGRYFLTGLAANGGATGYLVVEGEQLDSATEVPSLRIYDTGLVMLLGNPKPPLQLIVNAHRTDGGGP